MMHFEGQYIVYMHTHMESEQDHEVQYRTIVVGSMTRWCDDDEAMVRQSNSDGTMTRWDCAIERCR